MRGAETKEIMAVYLAPLDFSRAKSISAILTVATPPDWPAWILLLPLLVPPPAGERVSSACERQTGLRVCM